jgi:hypothetical protein
MRAFGGSQVRCGVGFGKEERGCNDDNDASCFALGGGGVPSIMPLPNRGQRRQQWWERAYTFPGVGTCGGKDNRLTTEEVRQ